jgi:hypothetical protein
MIQFDGSIGKANSHVIIADTQGTRLTLLELDTAQSILPLQV